MCCVPTWKSDWTVERNVLAHFVWVMYYFAWELDEMSMRADLLPFVVVYVFAYLSHPPYNCFKWNGASFIWKCCENRQIETFGTESAFHQKFKPNAHMNKCTHTYSTAHNIDKTKN